MKKDVKKEYEEDKKKYLEKRKWKLIKRKIKGNMSKWKRWNKK